MKIPLIGNVKLVDKDGYATDEMKAWISELQTSMGQSLSDEGLAVPSQSTDNINYINSKTGFNMIWYDKDTSDYKVNVNGVVKKITVS